MKSLSYQLRCWGGEPEPVEHDVAPPEGSEEPSGGRAVPLERTGNYQIVEIAGLYWHFVDLVWVFIFALFYLW